MAIRKESIAVDAGQSFRLLRWTNNLRDVDSILDSGCAARISGFGDRWHFHAAMELSMMDTGSGTRFVGDSIAAFAAPDVVLIGPHAPHFWKSERCSGRALQWDFPEGHPFWSFPETQRLRELWDQASHGLRLRGRTAKTIAREAAELDGARGFERFARFLTILNIIAEAPKGDRERLSSSAFNLSAMHGQQPAIERVIRHVLDHYAEPIPLEGMLKLARMSKATFSRHFLKTAGKPFVVFVNEVRLDAACRALVSGDESITEVALSNGFNSVSYFNRVFQRVRECSPLAYRKRGGK